LKQGSIWGAPKDFMYALQREDRTLCVMWTNDVDVIKSLIFSDLVEKISSIPESEREKFLNDTITLRKLMLDKISGYNKLPEDIHNIGVFAHAQSTSIGYVMLEYNFSNTNDVKDKEDSVY
jgi:hypothetical protein